MSIKNTIKDILNEYHNMNTKLEDSFRKANVRYKAQQDIYSAEQNTLLLKNDYEAAIGIFSTEADMLNKKINGTLADLKKTVYTDLNKSEKTAGYSIRINNALQFLQAEGINLTDETAAHILSEFITDIETMCQFRRVIQHQLGDDVHLDNTQGKTKYPLTLGYLQACEEIFSAVDEMQETAQHMFMFEKRPTESENINGLTLIVPMDTYAQLMSEHNIIEQADYFELLWPQMNAGN